jgi:two-component system, sensor histidine kinase
MEPRRLLVLDEPPILAQQLALVVANMRNTFWAGLATVALLRASLTGFADTTLLNLWTLALLAIVVNVRRMISKYDRLAPMSDAQAQGLVSELFAGSLIGGAVWGSLPWLLSSDVGLIPFAAVYALVWAMQAGCVSTMSVVLPTFLAFMVPSTAGLVVHGATHGALQHPAVVLVGVLFIATLMDQGLRTARAARGAIQLRFDNNDLLRQLREEHAQAEAARLEAHRASEAKSRVLSAASHDLRQPVHAQGLFLELLSTTELTAQQRELLARATEAVGASSAMLATLFDYSRIEAGVIQPRREPFAIQAMLNKLEREFGPQADAKGLTYRSRESALVLESDPALLELILRNLIANAIRYTPQGGLLVSCRRRGANDALLEVWDTGIGIEPRHHADVFREFHQLDNPERDRHKGFGLGLAIVEGLTRGLGHELSLRSEPGRGSVFRVRLPRLLVAALPSGTSGNAPAPRKLLAAHVVVVDDDESILLGMAGLLRSWGCTCETASTIEGALALAARRAPDLLITDYRLRNHRTGDQVIAALNDEVGRSVPAVMITGDTAPDRLQAAAEHNITLLHKPVVPALLYRALVSAQAGSVATGVA